MGQGISLYSICTGYILCFAVLNMNLHTVSNMAVKGQLLAMKGTSENGKTLY